HKNKTLFININNINQKKILIEHRSNYYHNQLYIHDPLLLRPSDTHYIALIPSKQISHSIECRWVIH
ncbi:hypothetical protein EI952_13225, partial [Salmonella enterica]|nr:hypothetical protein [Salmonella enterica]